MSRRPRLSRDGRADLGSLPHPLHPLHPSPAPATHSPGLQRLAASLATHADAPSVLGVSQFPNTTRDVPRTSLAWSPPQPHSRARLGHFPVWFWCVASPHLHPAPPCPASDPINAGMIPLTPQSAGSGLRAHHSTCAQCWTLLPDGPASAPSSRTPAARRWYGPPGCTSARPRR